MNIKGTITYCNRCGFKIFRKGEIKSEAPFYYQAWQDIDPLPAGWRVFDNEHLCPKCAAEWKVAIEPVRRNNA